MFERFIHMFEVVANEGHGSVYIVLLIGFLFGVIIQYARIDKFEKIAGFAMLEDTTVPKMLFLSIGLASIGLYMMDYLGDASWHIKPLTLGGILIGGVLFGIAMAIFGKCPGTGPVSMAEGRIDVLVGAIGGVVGGVVFTMNYGFFKMLMGPNLGKLTISSFFAGHEKLVVLLYGVVMIITAILIPNKEYIDENEKSESSDEILEPISAVSV